MKRPLHSGQFKQIAPKHPGEILMFDAELAFCPRISSRPRSSSPIPQGGSGQSLSNQLAGVVEYGLGNFAQAEDYLVKALADGAELPLAQRMLISAYLQDGTGR